MQSRQQDHPNTSQALLFHTFCGASLCPGLGRAWEESQPLKNPGCHRGYGGNSGHALLVPKGPKFLAPCIPQAQWAELWATFGFPWMSGFPAGTSHSCPAFSRVPVESFNNLWKVLWPEGHCWEALKMVTDVL